MADSKNNNAKPDSTVFDQVQSNLKSKGRKSVEKEFHKSPKQTDKQTDKIKVVTNRNFVDGVKVSINLMMNLTMKTM